MSINPIDIIGPYTLPLELYRGVFDPTLDGVHSAEDVNKEDEGSQSPYGTIEPVSSLYPMDADIQDEDEKDPTIMAHHIPSIHDSDVVNRDQIIAILNDLFIVNYKLCKTEDDRIRYIENLFNLTRIRDRAYTIRDIEMGYKNIELRIYKIMLDMNNKGIMDVDHNDWGWIQNIMRIAYAMMFMLKFRLEINQTMMNEYNPADESSSIFSVFHFSTIQQVPASPKERIYYLLLNHMYINDYGYYKENFYKQIVYDGFNTHAWCIKHDIYGMISEVYNRTRSNTEWTDMIQHLRSNITDIIAYFETFHNDIEIRRLKPDRHIWSFHNGIYNAKKNRFIYYKDGKIPHHWTSIKFIDQTLHYDELSSKNNWMDIETPAIERIFRSQDFDDDMMKVAYAMLGKCLYDLREMDKWEIIMFIKGTAGTGKSTIAKILDYIYNKEDIGVLNSNIEETFGLETLVNALVYSCTEVKNNFRLDQAALQSMITGEQVKVARKNKRALDVRWKSPGILMGNDIPRRWLDGQGSLSRRILIMPFTIEIKEKDLSLDQQIQEQIANTIYKINIAYLDLVQRAGNRSVWHLMPPQIISEQKKFSQQVNPLANFLNEEIENSLREHVCDDMKNNEVYMPVRVFKKVYQEWLRNNGFTHVKINEDHYKSYLVNNRGYKFVGRETRDYKGHPTAAPEWIIGIDTIDNSIDV